MTRALFAGGVAGPIEDRIVAHVCCYCPVPHPITDTDRQALAQGATASHGMCALARAVFDRDLNRESNHA
jgi:hypothetical protein